MAPIKTREYIKLSGKYVGMCTQWPDKQSRLYIIK